MGLERRTRSAADESGPAPPTPAAPAQQLRLACPACGGRVFAVAEDQPKQVGCPGCKAKVMIPTAAEVLAQQAAQAATASATPPAIAAAPTQFISVVCKLCRTRMHARPEQVGQIMRCPDCRTETQVPALQKPLAPPPPRPRVAGYAVDGGAPQPGAAQLIAVVCPLCHTRLHVPATATGRSVVCPDCGRKLTVGKPPLAKHVAHPDLVVGEYAVDQTIAAPPPPPHVLAAPVVKRDDDNEAAAPRWTFFSGVFEFPFVGTARIRWAGFSLGLAMSGALAAIIYGLWIAPNAMGPFAMAFPAMALLWVGLWTYSFGASCFLAILQETAGGAAQVQRFADLDWRQWVYPLLQLGVPVAQAAAIGYLATLGAPEYHLIGVGAALFVGGPILLLGVLETDALLNPFSAAVWGSLLRRPAAWLLYYLLSAAVVGLVVVTMYVLARWLGPIVGTLCCAPVAGAAWFILARLLGRLAWSISRRDDDDIEADDD